MCAALRFSHITCTMCIAPTEGMEGVHSQHKCTFEVTQDAEYNDAGPAAFAVQ